MREGGILSVDDTVIEKLYSNPKYTELIGYFWSGKYQCVSPREPVQSAILNLAP
jgi:hypothetical protein